jgi:hypothetical protein
MGKFSVSPQLEEIFHMLGQSEQEIAIATIIVHRAADW